MNRRFSDAQRHVFVWLLAIALTLAGAWNSKDACAQRLIDKTLVVWAQPANLEQRGSGTLSILEGDVFDSVVLAEVRQGVWMPGSDHFNRTQTNQREWPQESTTEMVCIAIVYQGKTVQLYRNAALVSEYAIEAPHAFGKRMYMTLGNRHANRGFFGGQIEEARVYNRALSAEEIATLTPAPEGDPRSQAGAPLALWTFEDGSAQEEMGGVQRNKLMNGAHVQDGRLVLDGVDDYLGPGFASLVPRRERYAETLDEQLKQLSDDEQMRRFAASRQQLSTDRHRPIYHYVNPEGRLNDPNGLCFWQGRWHMFYQAYPPEDPRQHWGHTVSDDLIHWRDLPLAIYPDPERCCFSGAALVEKDRVIAMYHGTEVGNMVAISSDPLLLNWDKVAGKAVIPIRAADGSQLPYRVFDPCIWKKEGMYYSLSGGTLPDGPGGKRVRANFLLRSQDLANWEYLHPFVEDDRFTLVGDDGACPYFWPIGDRHILLFFSHMSGGQYLLGDYDQDRDKFVVTNHGTFNFGPSTPAGVHAPSAAPDGKGGVVVIFNMNPAKPTEGWNQIMTLPRRLTLTGNNDRLRIEPAGDIESVRGAQQQVAAMNLPANQEIVLESVRGNAMELVAEIAPKGSQMVELNVLRSRNREEFTRIAFYPNRGYRGQSLISIDSSYSSLSPDVRSRAPETAPVSLGRNETLKLRVFIDRSVVEVFVNGKQCVAIRVYPEREDSIGVSLRSQGKDAELRSMDAWQMKNIYQ